MLITTDAFGAYGGIAQYNRDLLTALASMPQVTEVVALARRRDFLDTHLPPKVRYIAKGNTSKLAFAAMALWAIRRRFDVLVCGHVNLVPVAGLLLSVRRMPLVLLAYGIDVWKPHPSPYVRRLVQRVNAVWSISETTRDKMIAWTGLPPERFAILPNAIDLHRYRPGPKSPELLRKLGLGDRKVIMMLGRLAASERYKGVDEVLEALPALVRREPSLTFVIAGDGDDRPRLERKASTLKLSNNVVFTGFVAETEKLDLLRLADVFVMPSRGEGFGFVFLEAMACGIPVIASELDGSREAVRNGLLGRVINPDDGIQLATAILEALKQPRSVPAGLEYFGLARFNERVLKATAGLVRQ